MERRWGTLLGGVAFAQASLFSANAFAITENTDKAEAPTALTAEASLDADTIKEIRSANYLVQGASDSPGFSKRVLESVRYLVGRPDDQTSYKVTHQADVFGKLVAPQHYIHFVQLADDGRPMEGMGIRVMLQKGLQGLSIRLIDYQFSTPPDGLFASKGNGAFARMSAAEAAKSVLGEVSAPVFRDEILYRQLGGRWKLVRDLQFEGVEKAAVIDLENGLSWSEERVQHSHELEVSGNVAGKGLLKGPPRPENLASELAMGTLKLDIGLGSPLFTDESGKFILEADAKASTLKAGLEGKFAKVKPSSGTALKLDAPLNPQDPGRFEFAVDVAQELEVAQTTAYFHTTNIHNWLLARGVKSKGMDKMVTANVNLASTCNAYYTGGTINFFKMGASGSRKCVNTAYDSVVYHEYGHLVDDSIGGITNGGLSEGWGDVLSMYILGIPEVGKDFFLAGQDTNNFIRTGTNAYQYPKNGSDAVHKLGQAWMGFAWKFREALIAKYGAEKGAAKAEELVLPSLVSNAKDIPACVRETLVRNDDDGDLKNGTPDLAELTAAAKAHNLDQFLKI